VDQITKEKRSIKGRRIQYTKKEKKESLCKEKSSKEERKANAVIINV
jgi:hypothetical protein